MAKLSDEELRNAAEIAFAEYCQHNAPKTGLPWLEFAEGLRTMAIGAMVSFTRAETERMGNVDVAGIAREIVKRIYESPCSTPTPIVETILRSHLEGKSE